MTNLDAVYLERNLLAIALAHMALAAGLPAGRGIDNDLAKDWDPEWLRVVYVTLPDGQQVSWHMGPGTELAWAALPKFEGEWDGTMLGREPGWPLEVSWGADVVRGTGFHLQWALDLVAEDPGLTHYSHNAQHMHAEATRVLALSKGES